ncbi:2-hydroxyacid dehydrogenase [Mesorhizobium helmanticense]|uniref:2-hydroxyacid dehydrogenase n=1 Tax=Mesorhizobium helmanticense TaxID=1776423 RepID=A0A2T4IY55_9HYPH|nr:2-hydroxyacid dehydrogenase [Mesorhizobium helmanticense]PTE10542.1 2-hydroxyacid dehydrogenase [Mesorhizobium helmanticense]
MTKTEQSLPVAILVPGQFNDHAAGRIDRTLRQVKIERADPSLVTDDMRRTVRGIASFGGINAAFIDALPNLEIIANFGVGYDSVDTRHAAQRGIMVTNTPDVLTEEVADTAIGLLINTIRELPRAETWLRDGSWVREGNYPLSRLTLRGRAIGIFGMGRIGLAIARRLEAFALPIAYHNRRRVEGLSYDYHPTLKGLASAVDTLISVAPGGASTEKAVNAEILQALGPNGVFINIGRGSTVDEAALAATLANKTIAAAGLDVFADEPNVPQPLLDAPNMSLLPHVGSASEHTRRAMADLCVDNLVSWFSQGRALTPVPETEKVKARR